MGIPVLLYTDQIAELQDLATDWTIGTYSIEYPFDAATFGKLTCLDVTKMARKLMDFPENHRLILADLSRKEYKGGKFDFEYTGPTAFSFLVLIKPNQESCSCLLTAQTQKPEKSEMGKTVSLTMSPATIDISQIEDEQLRAAAEMATSLDDIMLLDGDPESTALHLALRQAERLL